MVALDELWTVSDSSGDQVSLLDTIQDPLPLDPATEMDTTEMKDRLADDRAPAEREKLVVALYYYENLTLREIGEVLGVTESRVSASHQGCPAAQSRLQASPWRRGLTGRARVPRLWFRDDRHRDELRIRVSQQAAVADLGRRRY